MLTTKALQPSRQVPSPRVTGPALSPPSPAIPSLSVAQPVASVLDPFASEQQTTFRRVAFYSGLGLLFLRVSLVQEWVSYFVGVNTYLLYLFAPTAILGAFTTGSIVRTLQAKAGWLWVAFFAWMILATPMSSWPGGSLGRIMNYGRVDFVFLFIMGGLALNWSDARMIFNTIAGAAVINVAAFRLLGTNDMGGRTNLASMISIGNSNDLAAHLLLVLPFLGLLAMSRKRSIVVRLGIFAVLAVGILLILGTGSRGALIGMGVALLFALALANWRQRAVVIAGLIIMGVTAPLVLPESTLTRLGSLFGEEHVEAEESARSREYLFNKSLEFTWQYPLFGVGPDQFSNFEGGQRVEAGLVGSWHATHCAWTQISSECGIPAFLFFVGGLATALMMVWRTHLRARREGFVDIKNATLCYLIGMLAHLGAITFLSNAYEYLLPAMVGIAITIHFAANRHMNLNASHAFSNTTRVLATR